MATASLDSRGVERPPDPLGAEFRGAVAVRFDAVGRRIDGGGGV